jgi:hypothetical protein
MSLAGSTSLHSVTIQRVLAQSTVSDLAAAERWYSALFMRRPDARPMPGLLEWHLGDTFGVQVWSEPDRAGRSSMVLGESDLDALAARLTEAGLDHPGPQHATSSRVLLLEDPDGNRVVFAGS